MASPHQDGQESVQLKNQADDQSMNQAEETHLNLVVEDNVANKENVVNFQSGGESSNPTEQTPMTPQGVQPSQRLPQIYQTLYPSPVRMKSSVNPAVRKYLQNIQEDFDSNGEDAGEMDRAEREVLPPIDRPSSAEDGTSTSGSVAANPRRDADGCALGGNVK